MRVPSGVAGLFIGWKSEELSAALVCADVGAAGFAAKKYVLFVWSTDGTFPIYINSPCFFCPFLTVWTFWSRSFHYIFTGELSK